MHFHTRMLTLTKLPLNAVFVFLLWHSSFSTWCIRSILMYRLLNARPCPQMFSEPRQEFLLRWTHKRVGEKCRNRTVFRVSVDSPPRDNPCFLNLSKHFLKFLTPFHILHSTLSCTYYYRLKISAMSKSLISTFKIGISQNSKFLPRQPPRLPQT